ncbi:hypothetical protein G9L34_002044 [Enterococcus hirae]|nr:hypothetical protein [Enterococcus hirae]EMF0514787.1 hypothetical protein [Enterococcus hirae]EMF0617152.1 hypothetical protein [Enterococcus hirae]
MRRFRMVVEANGNLKEENIFFAVSEHATRKEIKEEMLKRYSGNRDYSLFEIKQ